MVWAGPFDLGLYGALNNWFVARRTLRHVDRHPGPDVGPGGDADDRAARHARRRLAQRLGGDRRDRAGRGLPAGLAVPGAPAGGSRLVPDRIAPGRKARRARAALQPRRGDAHARLLAAVALHRAGLSGAGRRQPAPGAAPDRTRPLADRRRDGDQLLFGDVGGGELRRRLPAATLAAALRHVGAGGAAEHRLLRPDRRHHGRTRPTWPPACSAWALAA